VLLQARPRRAARVGFRTWALGDEDVLALMRAAYGQRGLGHQGVGADSQVDGMPR
jgi:hypothetical protein